MNAVLGVSELRIETPTSGVVAPTSGQAIIFVDQADNQLKICTSGVGPARIGLSSGSIISGMVGNGAVVSGSIASGLLNNLTVAFASGSSIRVVPGSTFGLTTVGASGFYEIPISSGGGFQSGNIGDVGQVPYNIIIGDAKTGASLTDYTQANTFIGAGAGRSVTATSTADARLFARNNVGIGTLAMANTVHGGDNVAIGVQTLFANTGGSQNVAIGFETLFNNTGDGNVGIGWGTGGNCTGSFNTLLGSGAGRNASSGDSNVFIGNNADVADVGAGQANAVGIGTNSFCPDSSVVIGASAGSNNGGSGLAGVGFHLVAIGYFAAASITTATDLILIGDHAGTSLTTGGKSVIIGSSADVVDAATLQTVVIGKSSKGVDNGVAIGYNTGVNQTNVAVGNVLIGYQTGNSLTNGQDNVFVGLQTGTTFDTGSNNVVVGAQTAGGSGFSFCTLIGAQLTATATNDLQVVSGDCGLQRADPAVLALTGGGATPGGAMQLTGIPTASQPPVSPANSFRLYYDSTLNQLMYSKNGAAYAQMTLP